MATKKTEAQIEFKVVTSEFSSGIKDMNSDIKTLSNELKLNATQLKGNADDVNLLKQRQELLQKELETSSQKVELTNSSLLEAERLLGKNSTEYKNLYNQLLSAKNQQQAIQNEIDETTTKIKQQDNSLDDAETSWKELDNALDDANDGFTITKGVLADLASSGIQSVVSGVGNIASSIYETVDATEEYRSMMSKLEGSTKSFGYSTEFSTEKFDEFYKYLGDNQMSTNAITNLMGLQTSQESLTALTEASIGVWSAYGDSIPIESLTESINETAQVGKVTGVMADALNWAGVSEDDFNAKLEKTSSTQERAELIADTLNGIYGESKATYDELSGSILNANEKENEFQKSQSNLAEAVTPLKDKITELKTQGFEALQPFVEKVVNGFLSFTNWASENQTLLGVIVTIIGSIATATLLVNGAVGAYNLIMPIYTAVTTGASISTTALGGAIAFLTSPITIAIAIIGALIAVGVLLWKNWDTVKEKAGQLKDGVVNTFTKLKDGAVNKITLLKDGMVNKFTSAKDKVGGIVDKIKGLFNFQFSLPDIKTPHFNIQPSGWKIGDLLKGSIPRLGVEWYKSGGILTQPTAFGMRGNTILAGGEAGAEAVLPINLLETYINNAFMRSAYQNQIYNAEQTDRIVEAVERLENMGIYMDSYKVGQATANANDSINGHRVNLRGRGVSLA